MLETIGLIIQCFIGLGIITCALALTRIANACEEDVGLGRLLGEEEEKPKRRSSLYRPQVGIRKDS